MARPSTPALLRTYASLSKPGIVMGNLVALAGGFLLGAHGSVDWLRALALAAGAACVVASGCAINNVVDRDIDVLMARTRGRPMAAGLVPVRRALAFAFALLAAGCLLAWAATRTLLPVALLAAGHAVYVLAYTLRLKRTSVHGTLVGSLAGAMPPVAGYCAAAGRVDGAALLLLAMFALWQMPHSYAIAIFRAADYRAAAIPVLPVVRGNRTAKRHMVLYMLAFALVAPLLALSGHAGPLYLLVSTAGAGWWLWLGAAGFGAADDARWARRVFFASIAIVTALCAAMALDGWLPHAARARKAPALPEGAAITRAARH